MAQPARAKVTAASLLILATAIIANPASALVPQANSSLQHQFKQDSSLIEVAARRGGAVRRTTVVGPRGGAASRTVVRGGAVVRPGYHGGGCGGRARLVMGGPEEVRLPPGRLSAL